MLHGVVQRIKLENAQGLRERLTRFAYLAINTGFTFPVTIECSTANGVVIKGIH